MWFPKKEIKLRDPALALEQVKEALVQNFPNYTVSMLGEGWRKKTPFIQVDKSLGVGLAVRQTDGGLKVEPRIGNGFLRFLYGYGRSQNWTPYFCYSRDVREISDFLETRFGEPVSPGLLAQAPPRGWTALHFFVFLILPLAAVLYTVNALLHPETAMFGPSAREARILFFTGLALLCGGVPLFFISYALDDAPDSFQIPWVTATVAWLGHALGFLAVFIGVVMLFSLYSEERDLRKGKPPTPPPAVTKTQPVKPKEVKPEPIKPPAPKAAPPAATPAPSPAPPTFETPPRMSEDAAPKLTAQQYFAQAQAAKNPGDKIINYTKALELKPDYVTAYVNRASAYLDQKEFDRAIADLDKALSLNPKNAAALNNRGLAYYRKGALDYAVGDFTMAITLKPDYALAYFNRGLTYNKQGILDKALEDLTKAIELKPDYALAYYNRGLIYQKQGDLERSRQDIEKARSLNPKLPAAPLETPGAAPKSPAPPAGKG